MTAYFDCNATAPLDPVARAAMLHYLDIDYGNAGSRTHEFGAAASRAINEARAVLAGALGARSDEIIFTSGATEADNLAILGIADHGLASGRCHIVTSAIEHRAVLEPVAALIARGFTVEHVPPNASGAVDPERLLAAVRSDTLLVSLMHVNNETGIIQPIEAVAAGLATKGVFFHVDAAQSFGKLTAPLRDPNIHLVSLSAHKVYGPKGVGALVARRGAARQALRPLLHGGGQERGLRPGTLPVHLIAGFAAAAAEALAEEGRRRTACERIGERALAAFAPLGAIANGAPEGRIASTVNLSLPGIDSEAAMIALKDLIAVSNGSACTSAKYEPSHVLKAMGLNSERIDCALRLSWCHSSEEPDWAKVTQTLLALR